MDSCDFDDAFVSQRPATLLNCTFWCDCLVLRQFPRPNLRLPGRAVRNRICLSIFNIVMQNVAPPPCPKCGNRATRVIGQSPQPLMTYVRCEKCGHVFVPEKDD